MNEAKKELIYILCREYYSYECYLFFKKCFIT